MCLWSPHLTWMFSTACHSFAMISLLCLRTSNQHVRSEINEKLSLVFFVYLYVFVLKAVRQKLIQNIDRDQIGASKAQRSCLFIPRCRKYFSPRKKIYHGYLSKTSFKESPLDVFTISWSWQCRIPAAVSGPRVPDPIEMSVMCLSSVRRAIPGR